VSTLFVMIRYIGLCGFVIASLMGTTFIPGPEHLCWGFGVICLWTIFVYISLADLVMILRLWAMYNRSKIILGILLTSYLGEVVLSAIASIVYSKPKGVVANVNQILNLSFCSLREQSESWYKANDFSRLVHAAVMCILVMIQFMIRSVEMYRVTKQWRLGPLVNLLVRQGMAYFFALLMWNLLYILVDFAKFPNMGPQSVPLLLVQYVPVSTLTPRLILSIRRMHERSIYCGRGHGIDTGFGLTALPSHGLSRSSIVFVDGVERDSEESRDDSEDIQMERGAA